MIFRLQLLHCPPFRSYKYFDNPRRSIFTHEMKGTLLIIPLHCRCFRRTGFEMIALGTLF